MPHRFRRRQEGALAAGWQGSRLRQVYRPRRQGVRRPLVERLFGNERRSVGYARDVGPGLRFQVGDGLSGQLDIWLPFIGNARGNKRPRLKRLKPPGSGTGYEAGPTVDTDVDRCRVAFRPSAGELSAARAMRTSTGGGFLHTRFTADDAGLQATLARALSGWGAQGKAARSRSTAPSTADSATTAAMAMRIKFIEPAPWLLPDGMEKTSSSQSSGRVRLSTLASRVNLGPSVQIRGQ